MVNMQKKRTQSHQNFLSYLQVTKTLFYYLNSASPPLCPFCKELVGQITLITPDIWCCNYLMIEQYHSLLLWTIIKYSILFQPVVTFTNVVFHYTFMRLLMSHHGIYGSKVLVPTKTSITNVRRSIFRYL